MAIVKIPEENRTISDPKEIAAYLAGLGIEYERWDQIPITTSATNEDIFNAYSDKIEQLKDIGGYASADIIHFAPDLPPPPDLNAKLSNYNQEHLHDEDEVRFVIEGGGVYFVNAGKNPVCSIEIETGDFIRLPCGIRHWFKLDNNQRIRALTLFQDSEGWVPFYTDSGIEEKF